MRYLTSRKRIHLLAQTLHICFTPQGEASILRASAPASTGPWRAEASKNSLSERRREPLFPSGRTPWFWATTIGVSCTAGQKVSRWTQLTLDPAVFETAWQWVTGLLLLSWLTWGLTRSEQGTYVAASWSDPTLRPDKRFSVLEKHTFLTLSLNPNSLKWARTTSRCRTGIRSDELVGARVQGRREEHDINTLCPQSTFQELPVMGKEYASSRSLVTTSPRIWCETRAWRELSELQSCDWAVQLA